ncbi:MAG: MmcQ/YjbR family DNA-binding protein [Clostridia bacterium]|nr:MmcQ/YjbR family DNA-binding protein [Clostridia bacterium]
MRKQVESYIAETYGVVPELLWKDSDAAAIRHNADKKWFGIIMPGIAWRKLGVDRDGAVEVMNVKCDPVILPSLVDGQGLFPAYHMNKQHWITIVLDGSVPLDKIIWLLDASYMMTLKKAKGKKKGERMREEAQSI